MKKANLFAASILIASFLSLFIGQAEAKTFYTKLIQQNRNTISGHIFDSQRRPVTEVYVELQNELYSTIARSKSNGSGRYYFGNLSAGRFIVRVLPYGTNLEEQSQEVEPN